MNNHLPFDKLALKLLNKLLIFPAKSAVKYNVQNALFVDKRRSVTSVRLFTCESRLAMTNLSPV